MMKETIHNIIKWVSNLIKEMEFVSAQRLVKRETEPAPFTQYEIILFWFLYHHSNEFTGIQFKERLEKKLMQYSEMGFYPFPLDLDYIISNNLISKDWVLRIVRESFVRWNNTHSKYSLQGIYRLDPNELNTIDDLEDLKDQFNSFAFQSHSHNSKYPILLHSIEKEKSYLIFNLYHYGKFKVHHKKTSEISLTDGDF